MFWDTIRATRRTTRAGAKSRSSCALLRACRPSTYSPRPAITRRATDRLLPLAAPVAAALFVVASLVFPAAASAQDNQLTQPQSQPAPPGGQEGGSIKVDVNLVVLHTTVLDDRGKFVDVPVSMGLVIGNSGSMRDKRPRVNEAAVTLVQSSNPQDEAFVVNFNDDYYLDLDKDFTSSVPELKEA